MRVFTSVFFNSSKFNGNSRSTKCSGGGTQNIASSPQVIDTEPPFLHNGGKESGKGKKGSLDNYTLPAIFMGEATGRTNYRPGGNFFTYKAIDNSGKIVNFYAESIPSGSEFEAFKDSDKEKQATGFDEKGETCIQKKFWVKADNKAKVGMHDFTVTAEDPSGNKTTVINHIDVKVYVPAAKKVVDAEIYEKDLKAEDVVGIYHEMYNDAAGEQRIKDAILTAIDSAREKQDASNAISNNIVDKAGYLPEGTTFTWRTNQQYKDLNLRKTGLTRRSIFVKYKDKDGNDVTKEVRVLINVKDTKAPIIWRAKLNTGLDKNSANQLDGKDFAGYAVFVGDDSTVNFTYRTGDNSGQIKEFKVENAPDGSVFEGNSSKGLDAKGDRSKLAFSTDEQMLQRKFKAKATSKSKIGNYDVVFTSTDNLGENGGNATVVHNTLPVKAYLPVATKEIKLKVGDDTSALNAKDYIGAYLKKYDSTKAGTKESVQEEINGTSKNESLISTDLAKYYPEGTKFEWQTAPTSTSAGQQIAVAKVIMPAVGGGTVEETANVKVIVTGDNKPKATVSKGKAVTSGDKTTVTGKTSPNTEVTIKLADGTEEKVTSNDQGEFTKEVKKQAAGANITVTPKDGTESTITVTEEQEKKDFTIDTVVNTETTAIRGTGKPGAKIKITDASGAIVGKEATVRSDGTWGVTIPKKKRPLTEGAKFTVTQTVDGNTPTSQTITVKKSMAEENKDAANGIDFSNLKTIWTDGEKPSQEDLARVLDYIKTKNPELGAKIAKVNVKSGKLQLTFTDRSKLDLTKDPKEIFKQKQDTPVAIVDPIYPGAKVISGKLPEGVDKTTTLVKIKLGAISLKHENEGDYELVRVNDDGTFSYTVPEGKTVPDVITVSIEEKGSDSDKCQDGMQCKDPSKEVKTEHNTQMDPAKTLVGDPTELTSEEETAIKTTVKAAMKEKNGGTDPSDVTVEIDGQALVIRNKKNEVIGSFPVKDLIARKVKDPEVKVNKENVTATPDQDDDIANKMEVTYTPAGSETPVTIVATKGSDNKWKLPDGTDAEIKIDESTGQVTLPKEKVKEGTEVTAITKGIVSETLNPISDFENSKTTIKPKAGDKNANKIVLTYVKPGANTADDTETLTFTKNAQGEWEAPNNAPNGVTIDKATGEITFPDSAQSNEYRGVAAKSYGDIISNKKNGQFADWTAPQDPTMAVNEDTGKLEITPPKDGDLSQIIVNYKDKDKEEATPVTLTKNEDGSWTSSDPTADVTVEGGKIVIPVDQIDPGTTVTAKAVDKTGNPSKEVKTTIKPDAPEVTSNKNSGDVSISPAEGTDITEIKYTPAGKGATEKTVTVKKNDQGKWEFDGLTGTSQEGTDYIVTDSGLVLDPNTGVVKIPQGTAKENSEVKVKSKTSTNVTSLESKTTVPDKTAPSKPTVTAKNDGSVEIKVPTDDTRELVIRYKDKDGNQKKATLKKEQGSWSIPRESDLELDKNTGNFLIPKDKVKGGTEVSVTAKDAANNVSDEATATTRVPEIKAPEKPTVTVKDDGSVEITPPKDADVNEVVLKYLDKESGMEKTVTAKKDKGNWTVTPNDVGVTVDANGKVTVPADKIKGGSEITATVKNKDGKDSQPVTETVKPDAPEVKADSTTGSVTITPSFNADSMEITYTPAGDGATGKTVEVTKGNDGKWKLPKGTTDLTIDEDSGLVTIAKGKAKEGTSVTAKAKIGTTLVSKEGEEKVPNVGGSTPEEPNQKPKSPTISYNDGAIEITPVGDVEEMEITFTPAGSDKPVILKAKIENENWVIDGQTPDGVTIKNGVVTIAKGKAKEGTDVKAKTKHGQEESDEATTKVPSTTPLPNPNPQEPGNEQGKISQPIVGKDNNGDTTVAPNDPKTGSVIIDIVDKDGNQRQVTAEKGENGKWNLVNNKPKFDLNGISIDSETGKVTISSQILGDNGKVTARANNIDNSNEDNHISDNEGGYHYTPTFSNYVGFFKIKEIKKEDVKDEPEKLEIHNAYIAGYEDRTVRAESNLTRVEAAAMVTRLAGLDLSDNSMPAFKDMQKNAWYFRYINAAVRANMLDADNGMIRPNDKITRAEFAKMLAAIDKDNDAVSKFQDIKGHRYEKEINKIYGNNRIEGYEDGSFKPDANLTRAEAAAFLNRMFNRIADKEAYQGLEDKLTKFKDLRGGEWYYNELVEATNTHELTRRGSASDKFGRVYEKWQRILPSNVR